MSTNMRPRAYVAAVAGILTLMLAMPNSLDAGTITFEVVDDKGTVFIPNGHFEMVFTSRMSVDLGPEWGELAGHFERTNGEKLVWVNDGPPILLSFANLLPRELHVPQTPEPDPMSPASFFDVFFQLKTDGTFGPLEPGMQIVPGPETYLEGASGLRYPGLVMPINDLSLLPTHGINGTQLVWNLDNFSSTIGNFYLIEYRVPPIDIAAVPEPTALTLHILTLAGALRIVRSDRVGTRRVPGNDPGAL